MVLFDQFDSKKPTLEQINEHFRDTKLQTNDSCKVFYHILKGIGARLFDVG